MKIVHTQGINSKSRKTRVTVHVFCMSSYGEKRGFKVMERTRQLLTHKGQ